MFPIQHILFCLLTVFFCLTRIAEAKVTTISSSNNLVTGESSYLTFIIESSEKFLLQENIEIAGGFCELYSTNNFRNGGKLFSQFTYRFNSSEEGQYTVPSIKFSENEISEPITFSVREVNTLKKQQANSTPFNKNNNSTKSPKTYNYYTQLFTTKSSLYPNEATKLEYKIYLPSSINVAQWGLPTGPKKNATAWRFETPRARSLNGLVTIDGINYQVGTFHTTVSGIKPGQASIGPFKNRIVHNTSVVGSLGIKSETHEIHLDSSVINLDIRNLPPNPPANFKGDVGQYSMSLDIETKSEISSAESIAAKIILNGSGKISELTPPNLTNDTHWKLVSQSKRELGERRKDTIGFAEFDYLIQPTNTGPATKTPGFSFSYLDPELEKYTTISYPGLPIKVNLTSHSNNTDLTSSTNGNQMLGAIKHISLDKPAWYKSIPAYYIHIIPILFCLCLFLILAQRKFRAYRLNQSYKIIQSKTLKEMAEKQDDDFLKAASNYIQRWINVEKHPELKEIQELRDDHCYKPNTPVKISSKRKQTIIDSLKKIIILLFCFIPNISDASVTETAYNHYEQGEFGLALKEYQSEYTSQHTDQSADLLYNIGSCFQKLNRPAQAAIHYHRALNLDPYHSRAIHNLKIIQSNHHSIVSNSFIKQGSLADLLSYLSQSTYHVIMSVFLWLTLMSLLWIFIMKPTEKAKVILFSSSVIYLCIAILCFYAHQEHPDTDSIPPKSFAIISDNSELLEQPTTNSSSLMEISIASECRIITTSGTYSYIELPNINKTQGWISTDSLLRLTNDK